MADKFHMKMILQHSLTISSAFTVI